jgi:hypothetical protein
LSGHKRLETVVTLSMLSQQAHGLIRKVGLIMPVKSISQ